MPDAASIIPTQREIHETNVDADPRLECDVAFFPEMGLPRRGQCDFNGSGRDVARRPG